jgi:hypothetical protein
MTDGDAQAMLGRSIEHAAERVIEGKLPAAWAGEQLVALIRHWGYLGHDWQMPDAYQEFDLVMTDLECFPDGRMTKDEHIIEAARSVLAASRPS